MFEQHPVPQQISSYQFRLVGDMTLKQFFQLAAGAIVGLIVYSLPLPGFLKWPFIAIAVIGGAAFAFLPIQDRPLEQWLAAFFRAIYAPTLFVWRKPLKPVQYFATDAQAAAAQVQANAPIPGQVPEDTHPDPSVRNLDAQEKNFLEKFSSMIAGKTPPATPPSQAAPEPEKKEELKAEKVEVQIPQNEPVETKPEGYQEPAPEVEIKTSTTVPVFDSQDSVNTQNAQFSPDAAPPSPPTQPNIIVGQVMDAGGKIVEGAILEITDKENRPVRALKTNKAGHFMIVTPLANGDYKITTEKEGLQFEPVAIKLAGEVISPIAIKSKNSIPEAEPYRASWSVDPPKA
jgi:hypothetical protein